MKSFVLTILHILQIFTLIFFLQNNFAQNSKFIGVSLIPSHLQTNINEHLKIFLPYNTIILEIDYEDCLSTLDLSKKFPHGKIYSFKSSPDFLESKSNELLDLRNVEFIKVFSDQDKRDPAKWQKTLEKLTLSKITEKFDCIKINSLEMNLFVFHKLLRSLDPSTVLVIKSQIRKNHRQNVDFPAVRSILKKNHFKEVFHIRHSDNVCEIFTIKEHIYEALFD